jgi:hypothetical protein
MELDDIILSEINQTQKDKDVSFPVLWYNIWDEHLREEDWFLAHDFSPWLFDLIALGLEMR